MVLVVETTKSMQIQRIILSTIKKVILLRVSIVGYQYTSKCVEIRRILHISKRIVSEARVGLLPATASTTANHIKNRLLYLADKLYTFLDYQLGWLICSFTYLYVLLDILALFIRGYEYNKNVSSILFQV